MDLLVLLANLVAVAGVALAVYGRLHHTKGRSRCARAIGPTTRRPTRAPFEQAIDDRGQR